MSAALFARIQPTAIGALLNLFAMVYFFNQGGNMRWLALAHGLMVAILARIVANKVKAYRAEQTQSALTKKQD